MSTKWISEILNKLTAEELAEVIDRANTPCKVTAVHRLENGKARVTVLTSATHKQLIFKV